MVKGKKGILRVAKIYGERFNVIIDLDFALSELHDEVGVYAHAVLIHRKKTKPEKYEPENEMKEMLGEELADIIGMVVVNADYFGIDLKKAIQRKWIGRV